VQFLGSSLLHENLLGLLAIECYQTIPNADENGNKPAVVHHFDLVSDRNSKWQQATKGGTAAVDATNLTALIFPYSIQTYHDASYSFHNLRDFVKKSQRKSGTFSGAISRAPLGSVSSTNDDCVWPRYAFWGEFLPASLPVSPYAMTDKKRSTNPYLPGNPTGCGEKFHAPFGAKHCAALNCPLFGKLRWRFLGERQSAPEFFLQGQSLHTDTGTETP
jgi:hypothetical protein